MEKHAFSVYVTGEDSKDAILQNIDDIKTSLQSNEALVVPSMLIGAEINIDSTTNSILSKALLAFLADPNQTNGNRLERNMPRGTCLEEVISNTQDPW